MIGASSAAPRPAMAPRPAASAELTTQYAAWLAERLLTDRPARVARMIDYRHRQGKKYFDVAKAEELDLHDHLDGLETYAVTLAHFNYARLGCADIDASGADGVRAMLRSAADAGLSAFGIIVAGATGHSGGHVWLVYRDRCPAADITHQLAELRAAAGAVAGENYPSGNPVRLPGGVHKLRRTRGQLVLQTGETFDLDDPVQLADGLRAVMALSENEPPPVAPEVCSKRSRTPSDAPAVDWSALPDGAVLEVAKRWTQRVKGNDQLSMLARHERVTLSVKGTLDRSMSAQRAVFVRQALYGHFPPDEVRALATVPERAAYLRQSDRGTPKTWAEYTADIDRLIRDDLENLPANFPFQPTGAVTPQPAAAPRGGRPLLLTAAALEEHYHARADARADGLIVDLSQSDAAAQLGVSISTLRRLERELGTAGKLRRCVTADRLRSYVVLTPHNARGVFKTQQDAENREPDAFADRGGAVKTHEADRRGGLAQQDAVEQTSTTPMHSNNTTPPGPGASSQLAAPGTAAAMPASASDAPGDAAGLTGRAQLGGCVVSTDRPQPEPALPPSSCPAEPAPLTADGATALRLVLALAADYALTWPEPPEEWPEADLLAEADRLLALGRPPIPLPPPGPGASYEPRAVPVTPLQPWERPATLRNADDWQRVGVVPDLPPAADQPQLWLEPPTDAPPPITVPPAAATLRVRGIGPAARCGQHRMILSV